MNTKIQITKNQLSDLANGQVIRCDGIVLSASHKVQDLCKSILGYPWMTKNYGIFLEKGLYSWQLYLKDVKRRRRRKR